MMFRRATPFVLWLALSAVLVYSTREERAQDLRNLEYKVWVDGERYSMASWRFWDDSYVAINRYLDWTVGPVDRPQDPDAKIARFEELLVEQAGLARLRPEEFWKTVPWRPFRRERGATWLPPLEDPGRSLLTAAGYMLLGGPAPYLMIWIGTLAALPLLLWLLCEAWCAQRFIVGLTVASLSVFSPYIVESLSLIHSAVAFYLIAALAQMALGFYVFRSAPITSRGLALRAVAASLVFAVCCLCRSGTLAMAPALGLTLYAGARRIPGARAHGVARSVLGAGTVIALFLLPYALIRPTQHHNFWHGYWQGLGDYGSDRGYAWADRDLKRWMVAQGRVPFSHPRHITADDDKFMKEVVLRDLSANPLWFAGILGRRLVDTVTLAKLAPWGPIDGASVAPPVFHYKYTTPADWFGAGGRRMEVPTWLLYFPLFLLTVGAAHQLWRGSRSFLPDAALVLGIAMATLPLPVLMTTAAGMETEAFVFVHFMAWGLVIETATRRLQRPKRTAP